MKDVPEFKIGDKVRSLSRGWRAGDESYGATTKVERMTKTQIICADGTRWSIKHASPVGDSRYDSPKLVHDTDEIRTTIRRRRHLAESKGLLDDWRKLPDDVINAAADVIRAYHAKVAVEKPST